MSRSQVIELFKCENKPVKNEFRIGGNGDGDGSPLKQRRKNGPFVTVQINVSRYSTAHSSDALTILTRSHLVRVIKVIELAHSFENPFNGIILPLLCKDMWH